MDAELARQYRERWQAVGEVEARERASATVASRWRELNAIIGMAKQLGLDLRRESEDDHIVWERWARLKEGLP